MTALSLNKFPARSILRKEKKDYLIPKLKEVLLEYDMKISLNIPMYQRLKIGKKKHIEVHEDEVYFLANNIALFHMSRKEIDDHFNSISSTGNLGTDRAVSDVTGS